MRVTKLLIPERAGDQRFWFTSWGELNLLRNSTIGNLLSVASQETVDQAYRKWTRPLHQQLGLAPDECLRKARRYHRECYLRAGCQLAGSECLLDDPKRPWCFEPVGVEDAVQRALAAQVLDAWREGVWVVVVDG